MFLAILMVKEHELVPWLALLGSGGASLNAVDCRLFQIMMQPARLPEVCKEQQNFIHRIRLAAEYADLPTLFAGVKFSDFIPHLTTASSLLN